jgi:hypothetical protein
MFMKASDNLLFENTPPAIGHHISVVNHQPSAINHPPSDAQPMPRRGAPNPFYVALMVVSTLFVLTALAYLVSLLVMQKALDDPRVATDNPATPRLVDWFDRHGPTTLAVECAAMVALGLLAMATDHWFGPPRRGSAAAKGVRPAATSPGAVETIADGAEAGRAEVSR